MAKDSFHVSRFSELASWIERDLNRFGGIDKNVLPAVFSEENELSTVTYSLFTRTNEYIIRASHTTGQAGKNYLQCSALARTPRAGEDHRRGRDIYDGPMSPKIWAKILSSIVCYELVEKAKPQEPVFIV